MKWFKHEATANMDAKLQEVLLDYGLEGYGLYWYCLELVAGNVEPANLTFELEHDCRIIARNTGSTSQRVQEMMTRFVELGLFENSQGTITCLKMAKVSDDYTAKLIKNKKINKQSQDIENKEVLQNPTNSDKVSLEENRTEENRTDHKYLSKDSDKVGDEVGTQIGSEIGSEEPCHTDQPKDLAPTPDLPLGQSKPRSAIDVAIKDIFEFWRTTMGKGGTTKLDSKRRTAINARLRDGYSIEYIKTAIVKCSQTPHNMGQNKSNQKYNDIELICRNASNLERFAESNPGAIQVTGQGNQPDVNAQTGWHKDLGIF